MASGFWLPFTDAAATVHSVFAGHFRRRMSPSRVTCLLLLLKDLSSLNEGFFCGDATHAYTTAPPGCHRIRRGFPVEVAQT